MKRMLWICILLLSLSLVGCSSQVTPTESPAPAAQAISSTPSATIEGHDPVWEPKEPELPKAGVVSTLKLDTSDSTAKEIIVKFQYLDGTGMPVTFSNADCFAVVEITGNMTAIVHKGPDGKDFIEQPGKIVLSSVNAKPMSITNSADWVSIPIQYLELKDVDRDSLKILVIVKGGPPDINVTAEAPLKIPE